MSASFHARRDWFLGEAQRRAVRLTGDRLKTSAPEIKSAETASVAAAPERLAPSTPSDPTGIDAYKPEEIARRIETAGVAKAKLPLRSLLALGGLAGAFISIGALFYLAVLTGADPMHGPTRFVAGIAFSLGLILVIVGGAELFTGNTLLVMGWVDGLVTTRALLRNWLIVFFANLVGALTLCLLAWMAGLHLGALGAMAAKIAAMKLTLSPTEMLARGILCNALVCLAVWLSFGAHDVASKILAIIPPIAAFVALGFEHCVANMFLLPFGLLAGASGDTVGLIRNIGWVTLGNIIGGAGGVALSYWAAYRAPARSTVVPSNPDANPAEPVSWQTR
ncbi:MAG TPA: formate/nitrite transporter family protein [Rhizomicrobium sp.]|nr:formate/nitrite transporter family protein [Rhizomicrobium sp.]